VKEYAFAEDIAGNIFAEVVLRLRGK